MPPCDGTKGVDGRPSPTMTAVPGPTLARPLPPPNQNLNETSWLRDFPPPEKLRDINRLVEAEAWGGYRTEFYPTYDYRALYDQLRARMK